jgi:predicted RNA-binding protein with TRAM domain
MSPKKRPPRNAKNKRGRESEAPVELGSQYEVDITEISPNGDGVARIKGFIIFVPNTQVGDHAKIEIIKLDAMSANAEKILA